MSTTTTVTTTVATSSRAAVTDLKLEAVVIPVADVDRSKDFYAGLGWRLDADFAFDNGFRIIQLTSPGSPASVQFGTGVTTAEPGSAQGLYLVVSDIQAAHDELAARGVEVSDVQSFPWGRFVFFADPDGNRWAVQQIVYPQG